MADADDIVLLDAPVDEIQQVDNAENKGFYVTLSTNMREADGSSYLDGKSFAGAMERYARGLEDYADEVLVMNEERILDIAAHKILHERFELPDFVLTHGIDPDFYAIARSVKNLVADMRPGATLTVLGLHTKTEGRNSVCGYLMEKCAEAGARFVVVDPFNPSLKVALGVSEYMCCVPGLVTANLAVALAAVKDATEGRDVIVRVVASRKVAATSPEAAELLRNAELTEHLFYHFTRGRKHLAGKLVFIFGIEHAAAWDIVTSKFMGAAYAHLEEQKEVVRMLRLARRDETLDDAVLVCGGMLTRGVAVRALVPVTAKEAAKAILVAAGLVTDADVYSSKKSLIKAHRKELASLADAMLVGGAALAFGVAMRGLVPLGIAGGAAAARHGGERVAFMDAYNSKTSLITSHRKMLASRADAVLVGGAALAFGVAMRGLVPLGVAGGADAAGQGGKDVAKEDMRSAQITLCRQVRMHVETTDVAYVYGALLAGGVGLRGLDPLGAKGGAEKATQIIDKVDNADIDVAAKMLVRWSADNLDVQPKPRPPHAAAFPTAAEKAANMTALDEFERQVAEDFMLTTSGMLDRGVSLRGIPPRFVSRVALLGICNRLSKTAKERLVSFKATPSRKTLDLEFV